MTLLGGMADWRNGMAEYMEYSKRRNLQNIVYFIRTDKEAEAKNARLFWNVENSIFVLPFTIVLMTVLKAILTGEGSC